MSWIFYLVFAYVLGALLLCAYEMWDYRCHTSPKPSWKRIRQSFVTWRFPVVFVLWLPVVLLAWASWLNDWLTGRL